MISQFASEAVRRAVLAAIAAGPQSLGVVVALAETAADDPGTARVAAILQAMARRGDITLATDGQRWIVALGQSARPPGRFLCLADGLRRLRRRLGPAAMA